MKIKFLRRVGSRYSKFGKGRKKLLKWRRPTGRDNKMREKRKGYPIVVSVGYKQNAKVRGEIKDKKPVMIMNVKDLEKIKKSEIGIIGKVGKKKKIEIAKVAKEKKIEIHNLNAGKFLKKIEKQKKDKVRVKPEVKKTGKKEGKSESEGKEKSIEDKSAPKGVPSLDEDINKEGKDKK